MAPIALDRPLLRRLQLTAQRLAGAPARGIVEVVESLRRIQLDPTNAVARSHELVLWSRLGDWDRDELTRLIKDERSLLEFDARLVPTAHWPIIAAAVADAPLGETKRARESREWVRANDRLRHHILDSVGEHGPLPTSGFEDVATQDWKSSGWSNEKNVTRMLELLARRGELIRAGRRGTERLWDLPASWLPATTPPPLPMKRGSVSDDRASSSRERSSADASPLDAKTGVAVAEALGALAAFAGARSVVVHGPVPTPWRGAFRRGSISVEG